MVTKTDVSIFPASCCIPHLHSNDYYHYPLIAIPNPCIPLSLAPFLVLFFISPTMISPLFVILYPLSSSPFFSSQPYIYHHHINRPIWCFDIKCDWRFFPLFSFSFVTFSIYHHDSLIFVLFLLTTLCFVPNTCSSFLPTKAMIDITNGSFYWTPSLLLHSKHRKCINKHK